MAMSVRYTTVNGMLLHEDRGGVETEYVSDPLGNLVACRTASNQGFSHRAEYWPYGQIRAQSGTNPSPWNFVGTLGYYRDLADFLYVRARYYQPRYGRWLTMDPIWPTEASYAYLSSPLRQIDFSGLQSGFPNKDHICNALYDDCMACRAYIIAVLRNATGALGGGATVVTGLLGIIFPPLLVGSLVCLLATIKTGHDITNAEFKMGQDCEDFLRRCQGNRHSLCKGLAQKRCRDKSDDQYRECLREEFEKCMKLGVGPPNNDVGHGLPGWVYKNCPGLFKPR
jgi:RHS repeat-associated protein